MAIKKPCIRCGELSPNSYCNPCNAYYNRTRRPNSHQRGYNAQYRKNRETILSQNPYCVICGKKADTADHIIPSSKGGSNDIENLQPMCKRCNSSKGNRKK